MTNMEQVEKLRERANVTYDEAKAALEASDGDLLDAIIFLERQGKVAPPKGGGVYRSEHQQDSKDQEKNREKHEAEQPGESFSGMVSRFFRWLKKIIHKGNINFFEVQRKGETFLSIPVTVLVILLLAFWITIPLLIVGLFFGCRYSFKGPNFSENGMNQVMKSASEAAENMKREFKE